MKFPITKKVYDTLHDPFPYFAVKFNMHYKSAVPFILAGTLFAATLSLPVAATETMQNAVKLGLCREKSEINRSI